MAIRKTAAIKRIKGNVIKQTKLKLKLRFLI